MDSIDVAVSVARLVVDAVAIDWAEVETVDVDVVVRFVYLQLVVDDVALE